MTTVLAVAAFVAKAGNPWMWLFITTALLVGLSFWRFHEQQHAGAAYDIQKIKDELAYLFRRLDELEKGEFDDVYHLQMRQYVVLPTTAWNNRGPGVKRALGENYEAVRDAHIDVDRFNRIVLYGPGSGPDPDINALRRALKRAESLLP